MIFATLASPELRWGEVLGRKISLLLMRRQDSLRGTGAVQFKSSETYAVTGGAGFLGSHICETLIDRGCNVICVDNFYTGTQRNIERLVANPNFTLLRHDVAEPFALEVDGIFNMACPASPIHYQSDPIGTTRTAVMGAINVLELATACDARVLQASTSEVYGEPNQHPQTEAYWGNVNPIGPRACYDEGKRCAETLFFDYHQQRGANIRVARIFNTYGPRMHPDDGRVVSNFIVQALRGNPITIYGDGSQTRSFCYVDDLVKGLLLYMAAPGRLPGPINLGNPAEVTIGELAERIVDLTGSNSVIEYHAQLVDDPTRRQPDITKARASLDWSPSVPLETGLKATIGFFEDLLSRASDGAHERHTIEQIGQRPDRHKIQAAE